MMAYSIIGWIGPIIMCALCWALFRKAGFRGGILAVCLFPIVGLVLSSALNVYAMQSFVAWAYLASSLIGGGFHLLPLAVLLLKAWPMKSEDEVFR